jgi:purine-nucleoside phosphorylase
MLKKIEKARDYLKQKIDFEPSIGIILGTGLNPVAQLVDNPAIIPYDDIPGMVASTAPSHKGRLLAGSIGDKKIIILQGRFHYYEGYSMQEVTFPVRILKALGVKQLILTNAAGSLNEELQPGNLVLISDHINLSGNVHGSRSHSRHSQRHESGGNLCCNQSQQYLSQPSSQPGGYSEECSKGNS